MTKYFELVVSDSNTRPLPKSIAEWLLGEIVSLPPIPLEIGPKHDEELEIIRCELRPPGESEPPFSICKCMVEPCGLAPNLQSAS